MVTPGFSLYSCFVAAFHFFAVIRGNVHVDDDVLWSWGIGLVSTVLFLGVCFRFFCLWGAFLSVTPHLSPSLL